MCNEYLNVVGVSREVGKLLNIPERFLSELTGKSTLDCLIPDIMKGNVMDNLKDPKGGVLSLHLKNFFVERETEHKDEENDEEILIWCRIIKETYGRTEHALIFLFSPIIKEAISKFKSNQSNIKNNRK